MGARSQSNTANVSSSDRTSTGIRPDGSPATGTTNAPGSVTNDQLAAMAANTVKANATAASASPQDILMGLSTIFARLASGNIVAATPAQIKTLLDIAFSDLKTGSQIDAAQIPDIVAAAGPIGDGTHVATVTIDSKGRVTGLTATSITYPGTSGKTGVDTLALAKLTLAGANGSYAITFANGLVTNTVYSAPT